jgi:hypothetical protein
MLGEKQHISRSDMLLKLIRFDYDLVIKPPQFALTSSL